MNIVILRRIRSLLTKDETPLGPSARMLLGGYLLSAVGTGTVFPYMAIYIQQVRGLGGTAAAATLAVIAVGSMAGSLLAGSPVDRLGPRPVGSLGLALQAAGYGLIGISSTLTPVYAAAILVGVGTGAFYSALSPAINLVCPPSQHRRAFAARYLLNNLGLGVGALIAVAVLSKADSLRFAILYEVDAASYLFLLIFFYVSLAGHTRPERDPGQVAVSVQEPFRWRYLLSNGPFMRLLLVQILLASAGFSQIQAVIPLLLRVRLGAPTFLIGVLLTINCVGVVIIQPLLVRLFSHVSEGQLLAAAGAVWVGAFVIGAGAAARGSVGVAAIILFALTFTVGECFYGPSFQALVAKLSPPGQLGRYSSITWSSFGAANFIAPPLGVLLVNSEWPYLLWFACGLCSAVASLCALGLRPAGPAEDPGPSSRETASS